MRETGRPIPVAATARPDGGETADAGDANIASSAGDGPAPGDADNTVDPTAGDLSRRSVSAVLWGALGAFVRTGMQIVSQVILARILGPEQYGLFAMGMVVVLFSTFFADVGLAYGLIQRKVVINRDIRFVFTWQIILGSVVTLALIASADWAGSFYEDERLSDVVFWLSLTCLINSLGATAACLLRRDLDFKTVNIAAMVSYAVGFLMFGIPMAMMGYAVQSLVVASLVQSSLSAAICYLKVRHPVMPLLWQRDAIEIIRFGGTAFATNLINWVMSSLDRLVVGRMMSLTAAGLYSTVSNFITSPSIQLLALLQSVLYSASSRVQDSPEQLRRGFRTMFGVVALFIGPVFLSIAAVAPTMMHAIYGEKWVGGEIVLAPLATAIPGYLLMGMAVPVLWASGNVTKEFLLQIPIAIVWVIALLLIAQSGSLASLSWSVCALYYLRAAVIVGATLKAIDMRASEIPALLSAGVLATVIVATTAWLTEQALLGTVTSAPLRLILIAAVCAIALPLAVRLVSRWVQPEVINVIAKLAERAPGSIGSRATALMFGPQAVQPA